jgi:hypothetical protein
VGLEGAEEFDPGERVIFFSLVPRTLDLRRELDEPRRADTSSTGTWPAIAAPASSRLGLRLVGRGLL